MSVSIESLSFAMPIITCILCVIAIVIITLIYHRQDKKFLVSYSQQMHSEYEKYKQQLEDHNKLLMESFTKLTEEHQEDLETHRHADRELFNTFVKLRHAIQESCSSTMSAINASRLAIYLFHNGTSSTHGISFMKMSCICEKVAIGSGVRERLMEHSNVPINLFDDMIETLITSGKYIVMNTEENKNTTLNKLFISSVKINYSILVAIYDEDNNMLGFVCAEMEHTYNRDVSLEEKKRLDDLVTVLRPVLSYSNYTDVTIKTNPENVQHD